MSDFVTEFGWWFANSVRLAFAQLNDVEVPLLGGDNLELPEEMVWNEDCSTERGAYITQILAKMSPRPVAVIGPYCSAAGVGAFPLATTYQLPFITPGAQSVLFNDRTKYPYVNRIQQSLAPDTNAAFRVIRHFGWGRVAFLGTKDVFSGGGADRLHALAQSISITSVVSPRWQRDAPVSVVLPILRDLQAADVRVLVAFVHPLDFFTIMQAAMQLNYYGPGIVWMQAANEPFSAWSSIPSAAPAYTGAIIMQYTSTNTSAITNYYNRYRAANFEAQPEPSVFGAYAYDGALLLAQAIANVKATGAIPTQGAALQAAISTTRIEGATGSLYYDTTSDGAGNLIPTNDGERLGENAYYVIHQALDGGLVPIGRVNRTSDVDVALYGEDEVVIHTAPRWSGVVGASFPVSCPPGTFVTNTSTAQFCTTCSSGTYAVANTVGACLPCRSDQYCPFAASAPMFAGSGVTRSTTTQPPQTGSLTNPNDVNKIVVSFGSIFAALFVILLVLGVLFQTKLKPVLKPLDFMFDLLHPIEMGQSPVRRQTAIGGLFAVIGIILAVLIFAFLISRFFGKSSPSLLFK
jgi:ABC-type branched-subunit amino acid transport system substrate-binding protein